MAEQRHVVLDPSTGDWRVVAPHAEQATAVLDTQAEAIDRAREVLRNAGGGELIVHGRNGRIRTRDTVPNANDPYPPRG
jgi:hypothetical protein